MNNWKIEKLNTICANITDGKHGDCQDQNDSGFFFISSKDIHNQRIYYENARQITKHDFEETHKRTRLEPSDILITNSGSIGRMALVDNSQNTSKTTFQKSVAILKPDKNQVYPKFLFYSLLSDSEKIIDTAVGTAQKNLLLRDLRNTDVHLPRTNKHQYKIAAILSAYDDLIKVNERRIALLERMAEELYREWFVRMRFPGRNESTSHEILPKDWAIRPLGEIIEANPKVCIAKNEKALLIGMEDIDPNRKLATGKGTIETFSGGARFLAGDTIFARITPCLQNGKIGKVSRKVSKGFGSTEFFVFRERPGITTSNYVYYTLHSNRIRETAIGSMTGASGRQRADITPILKTPVLCPPFALLLKFEPIVDAIDHQIESMASTIDIASATRDRLLSRLMSGALDVDDLDIAFPPSMEEELAVSKG